MKSLSWQFAFAHVSAHAVPNLTCVVSCEFAQKVQLLRQIMRCDPSLNAAVQSPFYSVIYPSQRGS